MKKIFFILTLIVILPLIALFLFVKMVDVNQYVPSVAKEVKKATGRDLVVDRATLDFSFTQGLLLNMDGVRLSDDPSFSKQSCVTIKRFSLGVDLFSFLLDRRIKLTQIDIIEPQVRLIRREGGAINFASLISSETTKNINPKAGSSKDSSISLSPSLALDFFIDKVFIHQGTIHYVDQTFPVPLDIPIVGVNLGIENFSLHTTFSYAIQAKVFSDNENFSLKGKASIDLLKTSVGMQDIQAQMDLQNVIIQKLETSLPMVQDFALESLKGKVSLHLDSFLVNAQGLDSFKGEVFIQQGFVLSEMCPLSFEDVDAKLTVNEKSMTIDSLSGSIANGRIFLRGLMNQEKKMTSVAFKCDMENIEMASIAKAYHFPIEVIGRLKGQAEASFAGKTPDEMMVALRGRGDIVLSEGFLKGTNLLESIFQKIPLLSHVVQMVAEDLPHEAQQALTQGVSTIKEGKATWTMEGRAITLNQAWLDTDTLLIDSRGVVMMPGQVNIQADAYLNAEVSQAMVKKVSDIQNLFVEDRIYIPVYITGQIPSLKIQPDLQYLTQKLLIGQKSQKLISDIVENPKVQKVLNSIFGSH